MNNKLLHLLMYLTIYLHSPLLGLTMKESFTKIYNTDTPYWHSTETVSGHGSTIKSTAIIRKKILTLLEKLQIQTLFDIPCGDFNWMKALNFSHIDYIGADIVNELIANNIQKYQNDAMHFVVADITRSTLPPTDLILCRDCFTHLPIEDIKRALKNIKRSGSTYILMTNHIECTSNKDIEIGVNPYRKVDWRKLNFLYPPFSFPQPIAMLYEGDADKTLSLWCIDSLIID